jgi:hypothetical protein
MERVRQVSRRGAGESRARPCLGWQSALETHECIAGALGFASGSGEVEGLFVLRRCAGGVDGQRVAEEAQVSEQSLDLGAVEDDRNEAKATLALRAREYVETERSAASRQPTKHLGCARSWPCARA